ncbi:MAG: DUF5615 family PIN-like protein [Armatimonadota bacterium]
MKLLFDQNLSPRLAPRLVDLFPGSSHVSRHSLGTADDRQIWSFARQHGFTLVTKDSDFDDLSSLFGFPPKVVRVGIGNCTTRQIEELIRRHYSAIEQFEDDAEAGVLALY